MIFESLVNLPKFQIEVIYIVEMRSTIFYLNTSFSILLNKNYKSPKYLPVANLAIPTWASLSKFGYPNVFMHANWPKLCICKPFFSPSLYTCACNYIITKFDAPKVKSKLWVLGFCMKIDGRWETLTRKCETC